MSILLRYHSRRKKKSSAEKSTTQLLERKNLDEPRRSKSQMNLRVRMDSHVWNVNVGRVEEILITRTHPVEVFWYAEVPFISIQKIFGMNNRFQNRPANSVML